jgi:LemA protein
VTRRNRYKHAYAQIDVQLKRRYDLIPNLVETAKGYIKHEAGTLQAVTEARNVAYAASKNVATNPGDAESMRSLLSAESRLGGALSRLLVVSEQYPDLKANQNMMQLTAELTSTENKISAAREAYNDSIMGYNTDREIFATNLIAGMFNFAPAELFASEKAEVKEAPKVSFAYYFESPVSRFWPTATKSRQFYYSTSRCGRMVRRTDFSFTRAQNPLHFLAHVCARAKNHFPNHSGRGAHHAARAGRRAVLSRKDSVP